MNESSRRVDRPATRVTPQHAGDIGQLVRNSMTTPKTMPWSPGGGKRPGEETFAIY